jgi:regulator of RNase E activity RraA
MEPTTMAGYRCVIRREHLRSCDRVIGTAYTARTIRTRDRGRGPRRAIDTCDRGSITSLPGVRVG